MSKKKSVEIVLVGYQKLLSEVRKCVGQTQGNISKMVMRERIVMAWQVGKIIDEHLPKNNAKSYEERGNKLIEQLAQDILITTTVLYKMRNFYKSYQTIPEDDARLNWSHYRVLSGIKKSDEREYLENLVKENSWNSDRLQEEVKKAKTENKLMLEDSSGEASQSNKKTSTQKNLSAKPLTPVRGKLFSYSLTKFSGVDESYFDLGFHVFRRVGNELSVGLEKNGQVVEVSKKSKKYSAKKSTLKPRNLNAYKAYLERVVDGDTIHVNLDLGFEIFHREIIRLRGIDAPEMSTEAGKKSSRVLKEILKKIPFLIVKTTGKDIYGRYVADVFLAEKSQPLDPAQEAPLGSVSERSRVKISSPQQIADEGIYLNQLLLDKGLAARMI